MSKQTIITGQRVAVHSALTIAILITCLLSAVCGMPVMGNTASSKMMTVNVPIADLRAQPRTTAQPAIHDPEEETQLLYGERVRLLTTKDAWGFIEAIEQPEYTHHKRWEGYPGWIPLSTLVPWPPAYTPNIVVTEKWASTWSDTLAPTPSRFALGTRLRATTMTGPRWKVALLDGASVWVSRQDVRSLKTLRGLPTHERRQLILRSVQLFMADPYYWGGRSPHTTEAAGQVFGVDCSGLVNLAYRSAGIDIPRDAHEQYLRARRTTTLQPADLIFLSECGHPATIVHVMLYAGDGRIIEGPGTGLAVRRITLEERFGRPLDALKPGTVVNGQTVYFGAYLP